MKLKNYWKRFWTLDRHHAAGFTLVELIVVIAILAILAGVAVPVYSGYIKKAELAADEQLLAAVNTAFAAACATDGQNHVGRKDVTPLNLVSGSIPDTYVFVNTEVDAAFDGFYEGGTFKVIRNLIYDAAVGAFVNPLTAGSMTIAYGGGFVKVTGAAVNALINSTYYGIGGEKLLTQVDNVAQIASGMGSIANVMATDDYLRYALTALGVIKEGDELPANAGELLNGKAHEFALANLGKKDPRWNDPAFFSRLTEDDPEWLEYVNETSRIAGNALVLYTAESTSKMNPEDAKNLLDGINSEAIKQSMNNGDTDAIKAQGMNQAALAYGMYYAYVNSGAAPAGVNKNPTAMEVIDALDGKDGGGFLAYMETEQSTKDMEAYLQALRVVNSSADDKDAVTTLVNNGFDDPELIKILQGVMGN